jgi:hypothetical protein
MRLFSICPQCNKEFTINTRASDRFILARKLGEEFPINCTECGSRLGVHVNEVKAEENKIMSLLAGIIFLAGTIILFIWLWEYLFRTSAYGVLSFIGVLMIPYFVYGGINRSQRERVKYFNSKWYG